MRCFWSRRNSSGTAVLRTPKNMMGLGVRETAVSVRQAPISVPYQNMDS
jgi:hypothetical protein